MADGLIAILLHWVPAGVGLLLLSTATVSDQILTFKEALKLEYLLIMVAWHFHNLVPILINKAIRILHLGFQHILQISILHRDFIIHMQRPSFHNYMLVQQQQCILMHK